MQTIVLGSESARESVEQLVRVAGANEVEIVDPSGGVVAYLVPAPQPGDRAYNTFEELFLSNQDELLHRQAGASVGKTTAEVLSGLQAAAPPSEASCDTR